jgi:DNA-3-methyladenine glycosylase II
VSKHQQILPVAGPWSLETSKRFWESFTPTAIAGDEARGVLHTRFLSEYDWTPAEAVVTQDSNQARIEATGDGNLDAAIGQVARFLSLDVDASAWPEIGQRDPVIAAAQAALPGFRPCGFHSPYEAACWAVLSQRTRVPEAARLRRELIAAHGVGGAIPAPAVLSREIALGHVELPGRKAEYLAAVAEAAVEGALTGPHLRSLPEETAREQLLAITGIGPFATDLILIRGTNSTDVLPHAERRLDQEITHLYGSNATLSGVSETWRPFRSWAAVHLRALREGRMHEMS